MALALACAAGSTRDSRRAIRRPILRSEESGMPIPGRSAVASSLPRRDRVKYIAIRRAALCSTLAVLSLAAHPHRSAAQQIYEQVDAQGRVTFTNVPSSAHIKPHVPAGPMLSTEGVPRPEPVEANPPAAGDPNAAAQPDDDGNANVSAIRRTAPDRAVTYQQDPATGTVQKQLRRRSEAPPEDGAAVNRGSP
jgi:hypothetical protein